MLHNRNSCSFPGLTDKCVTDKEMSYEFLLLSDLYCFQGRSLGGLGSPIQDPMVRCRNPKLFRVFILVNIFDFIKLFIH